VSYRDEERMAAKIRDLARENERLQRALDRAAQRAAQKDAEIARLRDALRRAA
jgi:prefoldin subunit 5